MKAAPLVADRFGRRYRRNRPWAVRGLSLTIPQGSITALVGPNGAGKSTLIRACIGFERPDEGRMLVSGVNPLLDRAAAVDLVGYVPQSASLYRGLTIGDHFDMACVARRSFDRSLAVDRLYGVGLSVSQKIGDLSGGEQAQVALALALGTRAPLLLLDEPLASLDPLARRRFLTMLVDDVRGRGATAVLSSHIIADIEHTCDRLAVLVNGRLVLDDWISVARQEFRTIPVSALGNVSPVGVFDGSSAGPLAVVRDPLVGRSASLEEIVLAHLAGTRT